MKIALAILFILPLVAQAYPADKRQLNPIVASLLKLFHFDDLRLIVEGLVHTLGSDETKSECQGACPAEVHKYTSGAIESIATAACPVLCTSFKEVLHYVDTHIPHVGTTAAATL